MNNFLYSYTDFIRERNAFRAVDRTGINRYDTPAALYYKLIFYFDNENGLLGLPNEADLKLNSQNTTDLYAGYTNNAYDFLRVNDELERAKMLKEFVLLLSSINSNSPWYFQEVAGLEAAVDRKMFTDKTVKLEEKPNTFTIKCLKDAYDNRIGTLLDLYRAACFSYQNKKEIVPSNLRKFNMGIIIFNAPIRGKGGKSGEGDFNFGIPETRYGGYIPSVKYFEFRNCEIDYNSTKSALSTLNSTDAAISPEYTITINYDDCYESRYNEVLQGVITDFINIDISAMRNSSEFLEDVDGGGLSGACDYTDTAGLKINTEGNGNDYWVNTHALDKITKDYIYYYHPEDAVERAERSVKGSFLSTQLNKLNEKIDEITQLPTVKRSENVHDNGTINRYGQYEYLNRINGMGGAAGTIIGEAAGMATNPLRSAVKKMVLGNLYGASLGSVLSTASGIMSGDVVGAIKRNEHNNHERSNETLEGKTLPDREETRENLLPSSSDLGVLPGWQNNRMRMLTATNIARSAGNNI